MRVMPYMPDTPRLAPLAPDERTDEQRAIIERIGSEFHIFTTLVRNPELFSAYERFAGRLLYRSGLPDDVRETLILRTAYRCRSVYEWVHHVEIGRRIGLSDEIIALLDTDEPAGLDPRTAVLVAAADQLVLGHDLDDATWTGLRALFDERQVIEVCMLVGDYVMTAGVLRALRVRLEDGYPAPDWPA
jgi:4-carboxymuconolactone decarboxylase